MKIRNKVKKGRHSGLQDRCGFNYRDSGVDSSIRYIQSGCISNRKKEIGDGCRFSKTLLSAYVRAEKRITVESRDTTGGRKKKVLFVFGKSFDCTCPQRHRPLKQLSITGHRNIDETIRRCDFVLSSIFNGKLINEYSTCTIDVARRMLFKLLVWLSNLASDFTRLVLGKLHFDFVILWLIRHRSNGESGRKILIWI